LHYAEQIDFVMGSYSERVRLVRAQYRQILPQRPSSFIDSSFINATRPTEPSGSTGPGALHLPGNIPVGTTFVLVDPLRASFVQIDQFSMVDAH
jgi:hypothetical protein